MRSLASLVLVLFPLLVTTSSVLSQENGPEFRRKTLKLMDQGNLAQIVWLVRHDRQGAREAFYMTLPEQIAHPKMRTEQWLNTIARAFRLEGMGRPNRALKDAGFLWPITRWRGTMYEADGPMGEYDLHGTWD